MKLKIILVGAAVAISSAILLAQDEPQLTPRTTPKQQATAKVGPTAVAPEQGGPQLTSGSAAASPENGNTSQAVTVAAGTRIPLILKQGITTKNAHVGDPVYAQTSFPITLNDRIVIPPGTFVQGEIRRVQRPGKVRGRAELQMNFTSMIFPNGYTLMLPGAVQGTPGDAGTNGVKDKEGTIEGDSNKGKDVGTIVGMAIPGAGIGAISDQGGGKGAAIGAASGGVLGLATVLLTRGPEIQLGVGDSIEMVLERSLTIEQTKVNRAAQ
jgi:hypothetical protein